LKSFKNRQKAMSFYLRASQSPATVHLLVRVAETDAREAWRVLQDYYESKSRASIKQLLTRLVKLKPTSDLAKFIEEVFQLRGQLETAIADKGISLMDIIVQMVLIDGLPANYEVLKTSMLLNDKLTIDECRSHILEAAERQKFRDEEETTQSAFSVKQSGGGSTNQRRGQVCSGCGKSGHPESRCFTLHPELMRKPAKGKKASQEKSSGASAYAWKATAVNSVANSSRVSPKSDVISFDIDSDASHHFVKSLRGVENFNPDFSMKVEIADQSIITTSGKGSLGILKEVHYVPSFGSNLLSVNQLNQNGIGVTLNPKEIFLMKNSQIIKRGYRDGATLKLDIEIDAGSAKKSDVIACAKLPIDANAVLLWHQRFGHAGPERMWQLSREPGTGICFPVGLTKAQLTDLLSRCDTCKRAKMHCPPHSSKNLKHSKEPFELVHMDIKGPIEVAGLRGEKYILVLVDDFSRWIQVYALREKSDLLVRLQHFEGQFVRSRGFKIRRLRMDNAGEQKSRLFSEWLSSAGIQPEYTSPHTSQSNGVAERSIQTMTTVARALRIEAGFPKTVWSVLATTAAYLMNRSPTKGNKNNAMPYQIIHGVIPNMSYMRTIGSTCYVKSFKTQTFDDRGEKGRLVGYSSSSRCYLVLMPNSHIPVESANVSFIENVPNSPNVKSIGGQDDVINSEDVTATLPRLDPPTVPMPIPPSKNSFLPLADDSDDEEEDEEKSAEVPKTDIPVVPSTSDEHVVIEELRDILEPELQEVVEAVSATPKVSKRLGRGLGSARDSVLANAKKVSKIPFSEARREPDIVKAMASELTHLFKNNKVKIVDIPPGVRPIGCTWAHKRKTNDKGEITRVRSRICPWGFEQQEGKDYAKDGTAAPTAAMETAFIFLSIVVVRNMFEKLLDVDSAFTIPPLKEKVYMRFPDGLKKVPGKGLLLVSSLNGLKQSAHNWNNMANKFLEDQKFKRSFYDPCLYFRWHEGKFMMVVLWVDDFRVAADNEEDLENFEIEMRKIFPVKIADKEWYLGMKVVHNRENGTINITQQAYIEKLAEQFNMGKAHPVKTPLDPGLKLVKPQTDVVDEEAQRFPYREAVGAILWTARCCHPEVLYAANVLAAHVAKYNSTHVSAAKHCIRYLIGAKDIGITLRRSDQLILEAFADADHHGEPQENEYPLHSRTGIVVYFKGVGPVYCQSKLQDTISKGTFESEYRACGTASQIIMGFRNLLGEIGFPQESPTILYNDNEAAIALTQSVLCSFKSRHIQSDHHFIRQLVARGFIQVIHCPGSKMVADIQTKSLSPALFKQFREVLLSGL
jgi:hypothetical protein